jgi:kinesin family protein 2/24
MEDRKGVVQLIGLVHVPVGSAKDLLDLIGGVKRATSATGSNDTSSRSHAVLQLELMPGESKLSFVDLAGSEWFSDSVGHDKATQLEGAEINKSLLCLKECIRALGGADGYGLTKPTPSSAHWKQPTTVKKAAAVSAGNGEVASATQRHVPFRGSKLTRLLKDSFVGPPGLCRTLMVAQISPASSAWEHSLNTLRYADRVGSLPTTTTTASSSSSPRASPSLAAARSSPHAKTTAPKVNTPKASTSKAAVPVKAATPKSAAARTPPPKAAARPAAASSWLSSSPF